MRKRHLAPHNKIDGRELRKCAGFPDETNDCTVRAASIALDISYAKAHAMLAKAGRPDKDGPRACVFSNFMKTLGYVKHEYPARYCTVKKWYGPIHRRKYITFKRWLPEHSTGRYIVDMRGHVFAVIDGVVHDALTIGPRTVIHGHWHIK